MSWSAHLTHTPTGLALTFAEPVTRLDLAPDVAAHLASLLAVEARHRMGGVVASLAKAEEVRGFERRSQNLKEPEVIRTVRKTHPLCCDCDPCLNGGQHG